VNSIARGLALAALSAVLASCTTAGTAFGPVVNSPDLSKTAKLQLAVGTAQIAYATGFAVGTNVVATFRGPDGNNAAGSNTPTLTGPPGFNFGPNLGNGNAITGVLPSTFTQQYTAFLQQHTPYPVALGQGFGPFTGVFGYGLASDNTVSNTVSQGLVAAPGLCFGIAVTGGSASVETSTGVASANGSGGSTLPATNVVRSAELGLPIGSGTSGGVPSPTCPTGADNSGSPFFDSAFPINYYGGPPAWPSPQGYGSPAYFLGYSLGFSDFTATPVPGSYSLGVAYATSADYSSYGHAAVSAQLRAATPLPPFAKPTLRVNADGSGAVSANVPAGVTEAVIMVRTTHCDLAANAQPDNYAIVTHASGPQIIGFSSNLGPPDATGNPMHTFCTTSDLKNFNAFAKASGSPPATAYPVTSQVFAVGFDYPAYESSYPFDVSPAPKIANASGQADVTTTYPVSVQTILNDPTAGS